MAVTHPTESRVRFTGEGDRIIEIGSGTPQLTTFSDPGLHAPALDQDSALLFGSTYLGFGSSGE
jgi:hypothetical protein